MVKKPHLCLNFRMIMANVYIDRPTELLNLVKAFKGLKFEI